MWKYAEMQKCRNVENLQKSRHVEICRNMYKYADHTIQFNSVQFSCSIDAIRMVLPSGSCNIIESIVLGTLYQSILYYVVAPDMQKYVEMQKLRNDVEITQKYVEICRSEEMQKCINGVEICRNNYKTMQKYLEICKHIRIVDMQKYRNDVEMQKCKNAEIQKCRNDVEICRSMSKYVKICRNA